MAEKANKEAPVRYFKEQFDDEEVLLVFRKHPVVMRRGLVYGSIAILLGTVPSLIKPEFSWFFIGLGGGFVLSAIVFFPFWLSWYYSVYIVTNQRLIQITQKGMFHRSMVALGLNQIQMVNYEIGGLQETLLGFGTINIQTFVGSLTIHEVHHPAKIQKEILEILREEGIDATSSPMQSVQGGTEISEEE
jgi:hypothetical protein